MTTTALTDLTLNDLRRAYVEPERNGTGVVVKFSLTGGDPIPDELSFRDFKWLVERAISEQERVAAKERKRREVVEEQRDAAEAKVARLLNAIDTVREAADQARHA